MKKILGIIALLVVGAGIFMATTSPSPNPLGEGLAVGDVAPDFNLKNIDGSMVSLASYEEAKGFIVIFTCNTCPYAVMYEDRMIELHNKYVSQGYPIIAINPNDPSIKSGDSYEKMQERAEEKAFPFAYVFDDKQEIFPAYGATKTPHVYLLDKARTVQYIGAIDNNARDEEAVSTRYVEDAIEDLIAGKQPSVTFTKAIGCSIKYKKS